MLELNFELEFLLFVATTLLLGLAALSLCRFERRCRELQEFWNSPTGSALSEHDDDMTSVTEKMLALQVGIEDLRQLIAAAAETPREQPVEKGRVVPFENAVRMVKHGATTEDLTKTCGLNMGEAHLLQRLHATKARNSEKLN